MRKTLIIALFLLLVAFAWADTYTIGTGTSSTSYSPFYGLYDYSWNKIIYTAAEINTAGLTGAADIYGIGFQAYNTPANYVMLNQKVYVRHTTLSSYGTATDETGTGYPATSGFTQVFNANVVFNGTGWYYIMFNSPFAWDGSSNLEILWENRDGDWYSGYPTHCYTSTSTNYMTVYKYADDSFPTTVGSRGYNRPNLRLVTQTLDAAPTVNLLSPADGVYVFTGEMLTWNNAQGMASSYDLYLGTTSDPSFLTNTADMVYLPTLSAGTTYYWKVVARNANGPGTESATWSFKTPTATQLVESFENTGFPPAGWANPGSWSRSTTTPVFHGSATAYKSASTTPAILSTPMVAIDGSSVLDFWYRTGSTNGYGMLNVKYSTDRENWSQVGATITMPTTTTWNNASVALGTIPAGNYYLAFEALTSSSTSSIYIDHVVGPEPAALPPEPASLIYPLDNGWTFLDGTLSWTASMNGGLPSSYDVYLGTSNPPSFVANQTGTSYAPTLAAGTTYYWQIVPRNDTGTAANCPVWSFKTPTDTQLAESFDATTFPPAGWANPNSWSRSTTTPYYGAGCAYKSASTTAAILSTPLLAIDANSVLDFFYRTGSTTGYGLLNVKYSTDRQNWNQIGATIAMPTTTTWNNASVALGTIPAGNYYLAFEVSTSTSTASIYIDHVFGPEAATVVPDPVTLTAPADAAVDVVLKPTFTWTAATIGGIPTGYKVYCDTNANPVTQIADVSTTTYTATTALAYSTTYYWKVVAYNANGNSADSEIRSFTTMADPTIYTFPWLEDFGTTGTNFPPMNWTRWSGLLTQDPVTLTSASGYWVQDDFANIVTSPTNKSARINIYGATTIRHWLITPPVNMPGAGYQLDFDLALTGYGNSNPPNLSGVDDKFIVLIGNGSSWTPTNAVMTWDNDASTSGPTYRVYNDIPSTGISVTIPLDSYQGIYYIAFYAESTVSNADNDIFVDNVFIRQTPTSAVFTIAPAITSWDFGMVPVGGSVEKEFAVTNTGSGTLTVSSITQTGANPPFSIVPTPALPWSLTNADQPNTFKVVFSPQAAGGPFSTDVTITYNDGTQATYTISFTGSAYAPATLPLTEGWENGQGTWIFVNGTQTNAWYIGAGDATYGPYEGDNFAYISNDNGNTVAYTTGSASVTHIYKDIAFDADCLEFPLSFQWRCQGEGTAWDRMRVYLVDTSVNPVAGTELTSGQIGLTNYNVQPAWTAETITLPGELSGTVKRLVFSWRNDSSSGSNPPINLDNISLTAVPVPSGPVVAPNLDYPADRQTDLPKTGFSFQFSWNIAGSEPDTYNLYLANLADLDPGYSSDDFFAAAIPYEDISSPYRPSFTYVYGETYVWTVSGSNAAYPDEVYQWPPYEFTIEPDPTIILPHTQNFGTDATPVWPLGWTQTYSGGVISDRWTVSASTNAGGTANEMKCSWYDAIGVSRLITPPIDTNGIPMFTASFNHYYNDFGAGVTAKLQYSHDLNTWYDTGYAIISGSGSFGAYETVTISGLNAPVTYLAWVMDGNHYQFNYWYVDDVYLAVPHNLDAKAVSIDMYQVVEPLAFTPMATVGNNGTQTISFNVTMTIGGTTLPAQSVTALAPGETQQLSFGSFTPVANTFYDVTVTTNLAGDENPANDTITGQFVCIELNKTAYADVAHDASGALSGPATFSLRNPGAITDLAPGNPYTNPDSWLTAADWINGGWWGTDYNGNDWWQIDTTTGAGTDNGDVGIGMTGVAWDPVADILYGVSYDGVNYVNNLYTLDRLTGAPTLVGTLTWDGTAFDGLIIDIAWNNNNGTLYGLDLGYDAVFTIDPATLAITPLGYTVGYDLNYAQGMAFDQDTGFLYLAAYAGAGALMWVNTVQPDADGLLGEAYVIGIFQNNSEVDGFVIPYPQLAIPDLTIALESGVPTLSWNSIVGATAYKVYGSSDPYADDPWTLVATTASTTYAYTGTEPYHFFKVTAIDGPAPARTQFTGIERVRQVMQPTKVQSIRAKGPKAAEMGAFNPIKK